MPCASIKTIIYLFMGITKLFFFAINKAKIEIQFVKNVSSCEFRQKKFGLRAPKNTWKAKMKIANNNWILISNLCVPCDFDPMIEISRGFARSLDFLNNFFSFNVRKLTQGSNFLVTVWRRDNI
jgi:hypothetical protein